MSNNRMGYLEKNTDSKIHTQGYEKQHYKNCAKLHLF